MEPTIGWLLFSVPPENQSWDIRSDILSPKISLKLLSLGFLYRSFNTCKKAAYKQYTLIWEKQSPDCLFAMDLSVKIVKRSCRSSVLWVYFQTNWSLQWKKNALKNIANEKRLTQQLMFPREGMPANSSQLDHSVLRNYKKNQELRFKLFRPQLAGYILKWIRASLKCDILII